MSKILLCGDNHGTFSHVTNYVQSLPVSDRPAGVIFVGDLDPQRPLNEEFEPIQDLLDPEAVKFIYGNHEIDTESQFQNTWGSPAFEQHCIHGKVIEIAGLRIAGLAGVFRGGIWFPDQRKTSDTDPQFRNYAEYKQSVMSTWPTRLKKQRLSKMDEIQAMAIPDQRARADLLDATQSSKLRKHMSSIFPDDYDRLADMRADVLITHEAPGCHPNGFDALTLLAQSMGVKASFHGHQHDCLNYSTHYEALGFRPYGVGLRGISSLDTETMEVTVVVPGELDTHRMFRQERME